MNNKLWVNIRSCLKLGADTQVSVRSGFSLVELMMTMVVSSLLLSLLVSILRTTLDAYSGQQRRQSAVVESRAGLEILRADLRSYAAFPDDPTRPRQVYPPRFLHVAAVSELGSDRFAFLRYPKQAGITRSIQRVDLGNIVLVAYAVGFTQDVGGRSSQKLYRRQYTAEETYVKLKSYLQQGAPLISDEEWERVANPRMPEEFSTGSISEPVVFQVIQFKVKLLTALREDGSDPAIIQGVASLPEGMSWPISQQPLAVDVLLRATNRGMTMKLESAADWRAEGRFQFLLLGRPITPTLYHDDPEVETQRLRIHLPRF